jgi:hypothetical protein
MGAAQPPPLTAALPSEIQHLQRGPVVGELEGLLPTGGVAGWVCPAAAVADGTSTPPLTVRLVLADLLQPNRSWRLAELPAPPPPPRPPPPPPQIEQPQEDSTRKNPPV